MLYGTGIYHDILPNLASHGATAFMRYNTVNITRQALQSRYGRRGADGPFRRCQRALDTRWPAPRTAVNVGVLAEGYRGAARGDCLRAGRASRSGSKFLFTCRKIVYEDARLDCAKEMGARHEWQQWETSDQRRKHIHTARSGRASEQYQCLFGHTQANVVRRSTSRAAWCSQLFQSNSSSGIKTTASHYWVVQ